MKSQERVRFAPSPTGHLHIGNARTALFNYLYAARQGGSLILRIEDTDVERSEAEHERSLLETLKWLQLDWQEGPDHGGPFGPYRQSERLELYRHHAQMLLDQGRAFYCYCTDEELEASRKALLRDGQPPRYAGTCRDLSPSRRNALEAAGRVPCIRYRVPDRGEITFEDVIHGVMTFQAGEIGDFVLMRSSGMPSYNYAVVIDDHLMEITTVIRGEDHLPNTPRQLILYRELGWIPPRFAHHPLLMGSDRAKLSKRHGTTSVETFREMGILPEAVVNYLALLGGVPVEGQEIYSLPQLAQTFVLSKVGKSSPVFDIQKLLWINQQHLRCQPPHRLFNAMLPFLEEAGYSLASYDTRWLGEVVTLVSENIVTLREAVRYASTFLEPVPRYGEIARDVLNDERARCVLKGFLRRLAINPTNDPKSFTSMLQEIREELGVKGYDLFMPVRVALTGLDHGPELDRIVPLLSPATILERLQCALDVPV